MNRYLVALKSIKNELSVFCIITFIAFYVSAVIILNSFILSWTPHAELKFDKTVSELEDMHVLDMVSDRDGYVEKLFDRSIGQIPEPI